MSERRQKEKRKSERKPLRNKDSVDFEMASLQEYQMSVVYCGTKQFKKKHVPSLTESTSWFSLIIYCTLEQKNSTTKTRFKIRRICCREELFPVAVALCWYLFHLIHSVKWMVSVMIAHTTCDIQLFIHKCWSGNPPNPPPNPLNHSWLILNQIRSKALTQGATARAG